MKLFYLASPYTLYEAGQDAAAEAVAKIAARLTKEGRRVYSPIVHTHFIATLGGIDPLDHDFWMGVDEAMMERCDGLIVARLPGWKESKGVGMEIKWFMENKHVLPEYVDPT